MSEEQALETETEIEIGKVDEIIIDGEAETTEESGETKQPESIELKVEEDGKPPSRRLSRFEKRINNKNAEITQAQSKAAALEEENRLLRLNAEQSNKPSLLVDPDYDTFEGSDAEFRAAQRAFDQQETKLVAAKEAQTVIDQSQQHITQANVQQRTDESINNYYDNADALKVANYSELEGNATDALGEDFIKTIIASTDDAPRIIASMGASPGKTAEIARLLKDNPVKAFASALQFPINKGLVAANSKTAPDPEIEVDPGSGVTKSEIGPKGAKYE